MTALDAAADGTRHPRAHSEDAAAGQAAAAGPLAGGPTALGLPSFIVGAVALGQVLAGVAANCSRTHLPDEVRPPVTVRRSSECGWPLPSDHDLERIALSCLGEGVVGGHHVVQREVVRAEELGGDLPRSDQL
jgi:hypothetical protein